MPCKLIFRMRVILNEKHETYISQLQIMQKPGIVHLFIGKKVENMWFWRPFFCFANLKGGH